MDTLKQQMSITFWSELLYYLLHTIAYDAPLTPTLIEKTNYINFFSNLIIPSDMARTNYIYFLQKTPDMYHSKSSLIDFSILLHNWINKTFTEQQVTRIEMDKKYTGVINYNLYIQLLDYLVFSTTNMNIQLYTDFFKYFVKVFPIRNLRVELEASLKTHTNMEELQIWYRDVFKRILICSFKQFLGMKMTKQVAKPFCKC